MKPTRNRRLGAAIGIIAAQAAAEDFGHADLAAFNAPGECHDDMQRGEAARMRQARRRAKSVSGLSRSAFNRELQQLHPRIMVRAVDRIYCKHYPF